MERKSPVRSGRLGPSARWVCAIFSTMVWGMSYSLVQSGCRFLALLGMTNLKEQVKGKRCKQRFYGRFFDRLFLLVDLRGVGFFARTSAFVSAISLLTEPIFSRF